MNIDTGLWNKSNLVQTRSQWYLDLTGFTIVGGIQEYQTSKGTITVFFEEERIYTLMKNGKSLDRKKFIDIIRDAIRKRDTGFPCYGDYEDMYTEIYADGDWQESVIEWLGLDRQDLEKRFDNITSVWDVDEIPLCKPRITQQI